MDVININDTARALLLDRVSPELKRRAERLKAVNSIHVSTDRDEKFRMELELMIVNILDPEITEGYAVAVMGPSGAGKSTIVNRALDQTPALRPFDDGYGNPVEFCLRLRVPSSCTAKTLGVAMLKATGYPLVKTPSEDDVWNILALRLRAKMHKIIFLDEFQHVLRGPKAKGAAHLANTVKLMMQDRGWPVWIVMAGVPDMLDFVRQDTWFQMERRLRPIMLDDLEDAEGDIGNTRSILEAMADEARLQIAFPTTDEFIRRIMHGGLWRFGMSIQLIKMSLEVALWDDHADSELRPEHFIGGYRRLASCSAASNVFVAKNWLSIRRQFVSDSKLSQRFKLVD